jgi:hypothetical protein
MAVIAERFADAEDGGKVRLRAEPEQESYFDVYGEPEGYTGIHGKRVSAEDAHKELAEILDRDGAWVVIAEYRIGDDEWEHADSVGMCSYADPLDPVQNCYVADLMQSALDALDKELAAQASEDSPED